MHLVALEGWKLLPMYEFAPESGLWRHRDRGRVAAGLGLDEISYASGSMTYQSRRITEPATTVGGYLQAARRILDAAEREHFPEGVARHLEPRLEALRWFPLPGDIAGKAPRPSMETPPAP